MWNSHRVDNNDETLPQPEKDTREPIDKALLARLVVGALLVTVFIVFAVQNTESVTIEFLTWSFQLSQFLMMVLSAIAGVVIWTLAGAYSRRAKKKRG